MGRTKRRTHTLLTLFLVGLMLPLATGTSSAADDLELQVSKTLDPSDQASVDFGSSVASAGDVNSDGHDDVIVGAPRWDGQQVDEGRSYLYLGSASGLQSNPTTLDPTDQASAFFGTAVAAAGDVNSDGYDDVIVGAYLWDGQQSNEGRSYLYLGSSSGLQSNPTTLDPTDQASTLFGTSVAAAGDVNSDGYDDVIAGAYGWDGQQPEEGRSYLYLGAASGVQSSPTALDPTDQPGAFFGYSVAAAGDVNSDGYEEVIVGAYAWDGQQEDEGRAYLFMRPLAPVFAARSDKLVHEGETLSFRVRATDGNGDPLTYSATNLPAGASFDPSTRRFSWTPSFAQSGDYEVTFAVSDGTGRSDSQTIGISVIDVNRAPVLDPIGNQEVDEGETLTFTISGYDGDGDALTFAASLKPPGSTFDQITRQFSWTPGYTRAGDYLARFEVTDGAATDEEWIYITVNDAPPPPPELTIGFTKTSTKINANGTITPPQPDSPINLILFRKEGSSFAKVAAKKLLLDETGNFAYSFSRPAAGTCKLTAKFPGDADAAPASKSTPAFAC